MRHEVAQGGRARWRHRAVGLSAMDYFSFARQSYGLIDRLSVDAAPDVPLVELVPERLRRQAHNLPWLVPLQQLNDAQRVGLYERFVCPSASGVSPSMSLLFNSQAESTRIRDHLVRRMVINTPEHGRVLLRIHDSRVWMQLMWILPPARLAALYGPIESAVAWCGGPWHTLSSPKMPQTGFRLDAESSRRVARVGAINEVLSRVPSPVDQKQHESQSRAIDDLLVRAHGHGLVDESDRIEFACHGMTVHPQFDRHPSIASLLDDLAPSERGYRDATALLNTQSWVRIKHDLSQSDETRMIA